MSPRLVAWFIPIALAIAVLSGCVTDPTTGDPDNGGDTNSNVDGNTNGGDSDTNATTDDANTADTADDFVLPNGALGASSVVRPPIASQCAQAVIFCTTRFPTAVINVTAGLGQTVTPTAEGFIVEGGGGDQLETIQLVGSSSSAGQTATVLNFNWSVEATDVNRQTLAPGATFSTAQDPLVVMQTGLHYVRLTLTNDVIIDELISVEFGVLAIDVPASDFKEVVIDVRE